MSKTLTEVVKESLDQFNLSKGKDYDFGTSWYKVSKDFNDLVSNFLFPKMNESTLIVKPLGNRFDFLAVEDDNVAQLSEEYVILDSIPVNLDLNKERIQLLETNYPKIANMVYGSGKAKKVKFTLDDTFVRRNFVTLKDAINFVLGVYAKKVSDINVNEEQEMKTTLITYALDVTREKRTATDVNDMIDKTYIALLNLQNNSSLYNESIEIVALPYTTQTELKDILIITSDSLKYKILNTKIANTFNSAGLDITNHIMSFDNFNNMYRAEKDIKVTAEILEIFKIMGDYQMAINDVIPKGSIFHFEESVLGDKLKTITDLKKVTIDGEFVFILDINKIKYKRNTKDMLVKHFNPEFKETNYWLHYYSKKNISPFYNNILITI